MSSSSERGSTEGNCDEDEPKALSVKVNGGTSKVSDGAFAVARSDSDQKKSYHNNENELSRKEEGEPVMT